MPRFSLRTILILIALASVSLSYLAVEARRARHSARQNTCIKYGKFMTLSLAAYKDKYGEYPPRVVLGPQGQPWHSWRVLLLEFSDEALFQRYSFDEPWDGPNNSKLLSSMPAEYRCPNDRRANLQYPSYFYQKAELEGPSEWQIVEARHDIPWMAPDDRLGGPSAPPVDCGEPTVVDFRGWVDKER